MENLCGATISFTIFYLVSNSLDSFLELFGNLVTGSMNTSYADATFYTIVTIYSIKATTFFSVECITAKFLSMVELI